MDLDSIFRKLGALQRAALEAGRLGAETDPLNYAMTILQELQRAASTPHHAPAT